WGWLLAPVTPGETIYARFMGRITTAGGVPPDNGLVVRIALRWYDASGAYITGSQSCVASMTATGSTVPYTEYSGNAVAPSTAAFVRVILQVSGTQTTGQFCVDDIVVQRMGPAQAAQASAAQSLDSRVTSVEGDVSAHSSAITAIQAEVAGKASASAVSLLEARVENNEDGVESYRAAHTVALDVNGHVSGTINENDGQTSSFSILASVFRVLAPGSAEGMEWQNGYLRVYGSGYQRIIGYNFGAAGQNLVDWFGPNV